MIYEHISEICMKKGISIATLEKTAGLSNGTIGKWKYSDPKISNLMSVASVLKVSVSSLLKDYESSRKDDKETHD